MCFFPVTPMESTSLVCPNLVEISHNPWFKYGVRIKQHRDLSNNAETFATIVHNNSVGQRDICTIVCTSCPGLAVFGYRVAQADGYLQPYQLTPLCP